jgi:hypothetical protein
MAGWEPAPLRAIIGADGHQEGTMRTRMARMARRLERAMLGVVMALMARIVERRLLRTVERRRG